MKSKWFSKNSKSYPLAALIALSVVQYIFAQSSLHRYQEYADQNYETLDQRMLRDNVPSNIKEHIIYVQNQSTFNTDLLVNSISFMQIFTQFSILLVFWSFYSSNKPKTDGEQSNE